jgi:superoxide reductase
MKFYKCEICGEIFLVLNDAGITPICCGEVCDLLKPGTTDGAAEKHVPVIERKGNVVTVKIGSASHPMAPEHYIQYIGLTDGKKLYGAKLSPSDQPRVTFTVEKDFGDAEAYEYCNLHGLWKA